MNVVTPCIDLHTHTTASDGALSPVALLNLAEENGVDRLAITDHDTIAGYQCAKMHAKEYHLVLISGVEVSTTWGGQGVHIVGLDFDPNHRLITRLLATQAKARHIRCQTILDKLAKSNMPIALQTVYDYAGHQHIGRPHIAQVMVEKGYVKNMTQAFNKYLGAGKIGDVKSGWVTLEDTVTAINAAGGIAVVAHPDKYKMTRMKLLRLIDAFSEMGGRGIEVISGKQHPDITTKYARIANDKGLYASLGSDFHRHLSYAPSVGQLSALPPSVTPVWQGFNVKNIISCSL